MNPVVHLADIRALLDAQDSQHVAPQAADRASVMKLREALATYFETREPVKAVLGIDIFQYSRMPADVQRLIPSLFGILYEEALRLCKASEPAIFCEHDSVGVFVSSGDGGFQVFETPFQAIVFAVFFEWYLSAFNSFYYLPKLRRVLDRTVSVRYALTYDKLFEQDANVFGPGIINNARVLARDSLNRFLLDGNTIAWFQEKMVSVESLLTLRAEDLRRLANMQQTDSRILRSDLFDSRHKNQGVRSVHLQKIGVVTSKESHLDVYSLMLQVSVAKNTIDGHPDGAAIVTVGNLNPSGLSG